MGEVEDFLEGDILGNQVSSRQIANLLSVDDWAEADTLIRRLDMRGVFAVQRFVDREIESVCDRNKSSFGSFIFLYLAFTVPFIYLFVSEPGVEFGVVSKSLLFVIVSAILITGVRNVAKDWKYLTALAVKDRICKDVIYEKLVRAQNQQNPR